MLILYLLPPSPLKPPKWLNLIAAYSIVDEPGQAFPHR